MTNFDNRQTLRFQHGATDRCWRFREVAKRLELWVDSLSNIALPVTHIGKYADGGLAWLPLSDETAPSLAVLPEP